MIRLLTCACHVTSVVSSSPWPYRLAHQAPLSLDSPGKNTGVGCCALLQGTLLTEGLNPCLLCLPNWRRVLYHYCHLGSPQFTHWTHIHHLCVCVLAQSCPTLWNPWTVAHKPPLSMEFSRQEYWSALSFPTQGNLPCLRSKQVSPALAGRFFTQCAIWENS